MMSEDKPARRANQRGTARLAAVQALYQMDVGEAPLEDTLAQFISFRLGQEIEGEQYLPADSDFFTTILKGVVAHQLEIDPLIDGSLVKGWPVTRIDTTLRAILRAAAFELGHRPDVPTKVIITEYVEIARAFYEGDEPRMVNGVLDSIARTLRPDDFSD